LRDKVVKKINFGWLGLEIVDYEVKHPVKMGMTLYRFEFDI